MSIPIIFVHGAFCGGWAFDQFRKPFEAAGYDTHTPDLPHHERGGSLELLAQCGVRAYADAIVRYAKSLPRPPILVGHSLGGLVAQVAATRGPCKALVLLAPSAPWGVMPTTLDEHGSNFGLTLLGDYWRRPVVPDYGIARQTTLDRLSREDARAMFARFAPESGRAVMETLQWWLDHAMASAAPVYKISAPVLALAGGQDRVNPASTVRRMVNRFPAGQADMTIFKDMSHWLIGEPEWPHVAERALGWLQERGLQADSEPGAAVQKPLRLFSWGLPPGA
ncbi:MAG: alpha/beta hydrolase [Caulobacterales bacterium]